MEPYNICLNDCHLKLQPHSASTHMRECHVLLRSKATVPGTRSSARPSMRQGPNNAHAGRHRRTLQCVILDAHQQKLHVLT